MDFEKSGSKITKGEPGPPSESHFTKWVNLRNFWFFEDSAVTRSPLVFIFYQVGVLTCPTSLQNMKANGPLVTEVSYAEIWTPN